MEFGLWAENQAPHWSQLGSLSALSDLDVGWDLGFAPWLWIENQVPHWSQVGKPSALSDLDVGWGLGFASWLCSEKQVPCWSRVGKPSASSARFGVIFNVIDLMGEGLLHKEEIGFPTQKPDLWGPSLHQPHHPIS